MVSIPIRAALRGPIDQAHQRLADIVDKRKITPHLAVVKKLDRLPCKDGLCKDEHRHVRTAPGTVYGEKTKTRRRNTVQVAIRMRHQFVGLLRRSVKTDRVINIVLHREG